MQFIICESNGDWAAELWRRLPASISLVETRRLDDVWQQLNHTPTAVVALELTASQTQQVVAAVQKIDREFPRVVTIVLAARRLSVWEALLREAGATLFVASPRQVDEIVDLVCRYAARVQNHAPAVESSSFEEQILATLPWGA